MIRLLFAFLFALVLSGAISAPAAHAEEVTWEAPMPKGLGAGMRCIGTASAGGHTYTNVNYVAEDPEDSYDMHGACRAIMQTDVPRWFFVRHSIVIDPASVRYTAEPLR